MATTPGTSLASTAARSAASTRENCVPWAVADCARADTAPPTDAAAVNALALTSTSRRLGCSVMAFPPSAFREAYGAHLILSSDRGAITLRSTDMAALVYIRKCLERIRAGEGNEASCRRSLRRSRVDPAGLAHGACVRSRHPRARHLFERGS